MKLRQPNLKKVGPMKPLQGPAPVGQEENTSFFSPGRRGAGWRSLGIVEVGFPLTFDSVGVKNFFILFFFLFTELERCR